MAEGDEDKTAFFAGEGVFCYRKMPFGLKNARETYQKLVDKVFYNQIGRNLEAYVDDMVFKSTSKEEMLADIKETFDKFQSINMKLNPKKCSFGVEEGPFLGYLITKQGIRANTSISLMSLPFSKVLKSCTDKKNIQWMQEAKAALQEMKKFVEILPTLTAPIQGEVLIMYLTASTESISAALFTKRKEEQVLIYFLILLGFNKVNTASYVNTVWVKGRRVAKWTIELGEHDISFQKRGDETPKDFLIEVPPEDNRKETEGRPNTKSNKMELSYEWKLYIDRATSSDGSGAGLMLIDPEGKEYTYALCFGFEKTNNEAEYEALLVGL
ncbi:reverse transcriptase domain-containing protein [Tanacetum coccineum]|uniref:Reverse transcriptase domain-containing protein n=1 Tax=Tanacetum coccineum TaxID=301880 RepID=A0ABQ5FAQ8_9ASTR